MARRAGRREHLQTQGGEASLPTRRGVACCVGSSNRERLRYLRVGSEPCALRDHDDPVLGDMEALAVFFWVEADLHALGDLNPLVDDDPP